MQDEYEVRARARERAAYRQVNPRLAPGPAHGGFASALNAMLPRYNAGRLNLTCEAMDAMRLGEMARRGENN
eukprot:jgi/Tetstr1/459433/TSEL_004802.t1